MDDVIHCVSWWRFRKSDDKRVGKVYGEVSNGEGWRGQVALRGVIGDEVGGDGGRIGDGIGDGLGR